MKKHIDKNAILILVLNLCFSSGFSQQFPGAKDDVIKAQNKETSDLSGTTSASNSLNFINLKSSFGAESAEANITFSKTDDYAISLKLSTPVGKEDKETKPFTLADGLAGSSSLKLDLSWVFWEPNFDQTMVTTAITSYRAANGIAATDPVRFKQLDSANYSITGIKYGIPTRVFLIPAIGRPEFNFSNDTTNFKVDSETKTDFTLDFGISILPKTKKYSLLSLIVSYRYNYKASGKEQTYNVPSSNNSSYQSKFFFGNPKVKEEWALSLEYRGALNKSANLYMKPTINILTQEKTGSFEMPIYKTIPNGDKEDLLDAGIFIGYKTDSDWQFKASHSNLLLGVFISKRLGNLFGS